MAVDETRGEAAEADAPEPLRTQIEQLFEQVETRLGWPVTKPPANLDIRLRADGTFRLYAKLERGVRNDD